MPQPFNIDAARKNLQRKSAEQRKSRLALHEKAVKETLAIIDLLIQKYNPRRIYQWGSVLNPDQFDENSDIDIAVEGIQSAEKFFALYGDAMKMTTFPLDLVEIEKIDPIHSDSIREKGTCVYDRKECR